MAVIRLMGVGRRARDRRPEPLAGTASPTSSTGLVVVTSDEPAFRDGAAEAWPQQLEWPVTVDRAMSLALIGPGGIGLVGLAMLATRFGGDTVRGAWVTHPVGRSVFGALSVLLIGGAVHVLVAGVRHVPALRLDGGGITAWQGWRVRHIPWVDVMGLGPAHQANHNWCFVVIPRQGEPLRIFQRVTGGSIVDVRQRCIQWIDQSGRLGT